MDHEFLAVLRREHPAWRLLAADNAPFIIAFLHRAFIQSNARSLSQTDIEEQLNDYLHHLRQAHGQEKYPREARAYLDDWASGKQAFLRKYYPVRGDEPEYDLTPASEQAIQWLASLEQREFIGTESRLLEVIELLREIVRLAQTDPRQRMAELQERRAELDRQIQDLQEGRFTVGDPRQIKERFFHAEDTARRLLSDFRQVEDNFRTLDREVREKIMTAGSAKGLLLDDVFGRRDSIADSNQGKSFAAFWTLLMSPRLQRELSELVERSLALEPVADVKADPVLSRIQDHLLEAGERVQRTSALLIEQLRRFLNDRVWLENKRIIDLIRQAEAQAVQVNQVPPLDKAFVEMDDMRVDIQLPFARVLFQPGSVLQITPVMLCDGLAEFDSDALFNIHYVDEKELRRQIDHVLQGRTQITLGELSRQCPIQKGLAEVVCYFRIASTSGQAVIDSENQETIQWKSSYGHEYAASVPKIIFTR